MESIILNILLLSLTLRLETTDNDSKELLETMRRYNEACNFVFDKAFSLKLTNQQIQTA